MIVLVDMDDVLEELAIGWTRYLNDKYHLSVTEGSVADWDIAKYFPTLTEKQVYDAEFDDHIWDFVDVTPGAVEGVQELIKDGHEVFIVTATRYETMKYKMDTLLFKYFPFLDWGQVIVTENKQLILGDVLIDDRPHNFMGGVYEKILFDRPHNRSFDENEVGAKRVYNWTEVLREVRRIAKEKEGEQR